MTREEIINLAEEVGCGSYPSSNGIFQPPLNLQKFAERMHAAGKREAAEHILAMWRAPWSDSLKNSAGRAFVDRLRSYVEELK